MGEKFAVKSLWVKRPLVKSLWVKSVEVGEKCTGEKSVG